MPDFSEFVRRIHDSAVPTVLAVTGGGSGALSALLTEPGASRTILEARIPYAAAALVDFLGAQPDLFCDARTARAMAMVAYQRALALQASNSAPGASVVGLACTASLRSDRPKRGPHRFHVAWQSRTTTICRSITLAKATRTRAEEEDVVSRGVLNALAEACGLNERLPTALAAEESMVEQRAVGEPAWQRLWAGELDRLAIVGRSSSLARALPRVVFPGAFNPWHQGHERIAALAAERLQQTVELEISILNVDKPPLDYWEVQQRLAPLHAHPVWLTRAATFVEKTRLFPGATFVVGADTIARIVDPRYYHDQPARRDAAVDQIVQQQTRFLVFGRVVKDRFVTLDELALPEALRAICTPVGEYEFRDDISSSALRRAHIE